METGHDETTSPQASLDVIIRAFRSVEQMIQFIGTAANEQPAASGEISVSASNISKLATDNSSAAVETAKSCNNLSQLAGDLDGIIRAFRLCDGAPPARGSAISQSPVRRSV